MKSMDELLKKYWETKSELNEEQKLKDHFAQSPDEQLENDYFSYLEKKKSENLDQTDFDKVLLNKIDQKKGLHRSLFSQFNWRIAAAILILFTAGYLFFNRQFDIKVKKSTPENLVTMDTYQDPEKAFEETKKALMYISNQMNKGSEYAAEFGKFSETQETIKKK